MSASLSLCLCVCVSLCLCSCVSLSLCLCLCLSLSLSLSPTHLHTPAESSKREKVRSPDSITGKLALLIPARETRPADCSSDSPGPWSRFTRGGNVDASRHHQSLFQHTITRLQGPGTLSPPFAPRSPRHTPRNRPLNQMASGRKGTRYSAGRTAQISERMSASGKGAWNS